MQNDTNGDYKWSDENAQPFQQKKIEKTKNVSENASENLDITKDSEQKLESNELINQNIDNRTNGNDQKSEKSEKPEYSIIKSDILLDIKHILEDISSGIKETEGFKTYLHDEKSREAIERGRAYIYKYRNYYDVTTAIKIAGPVNPNDFDSPVYNKERIFEDLERYADIINVANDGTDNLFVVISHGGRTNFSQEATIFPGEVKTYYYVYELRLRSPQKGLPYRVTEYNLMDVSQTSGIPIEKAVLQDVELPGAGEDWLEQDLTPTRFPTTFRVQISTSIDGNFEAAIKRDGNTQVVFFNATSGPALLADGLYNFELLVHKEDRINFRFSETGGTIKILRVQEIDTATA